MQKYIASILNFFVDLLRMPDFSEDFVLTTAEYETERSLISIALLVTDCKLILS